VPPLLCPSTGRLGADTPADSCVSYLLLLRYLLSDSLFPSVGGLDASVLRLLLLVSLPLLLLLINFLFPSVGSETSALLLPLPLWEPLPAQLSCQPIVPYSCTHHGGVEIDYAAIRLDRLNQPALSLSNDMIAENKRLFQAAVDNAHFIRIDGDGAIVTHVYTNLDMNPLLGACLYIAQVNLGIEEGGLNVKRICEEVGCSSEELAKWSQLLKGLILPRKALERNVAEGSGMSMLATSTTAATTPADTPTSL